MGTNSVLDTIPPKIENIPFDICDDNDWLKFIVPVINIASFDMPRGMRVGQRLVNALSERDVEIADAICNTHFDVWQNDGEDMTQMRSFFERVFELFVERRL